MAKQAKRGLGRGLSALMADIEPVEGQTQPDIGGASGAQTVPIELISPNPGQPRRVFAPDALAELTSSISQKGIIQPLIVRLKPGESDAYEIVAGERRWRAAQQAKLHEVPVIIRDFDDTEVLEVAIIENIQRADLNAIEEALGYRQLLDRFGHTQEKLADAMGKSRSHIANMMRLLSLPHDVQALVQEGSLSAGHARALVTSSDASGLAAQIVAKGLSVRETEALVKAPKSSKGKRKTPTHDADTAALEDNLGAALRMPVRIDYDAGTGGGRLSIKYKDLAQLDDLVRALGG
ncbi:MAG: ParB/RepB/Spo0J family partition protein [Pseudomonadota bacterium]